MIVLANSTDKQLTVVFVLFFFSAKQDSRKNKKKYCKMLSATIFTQSLSIKESKDDFSCLDLAYLE